MASDTKKAERKKIILFSGGINSAYLIHKSLLSGFEVIAVHCEYAHKNTLRDLKSVLKLHSYWKRSNQAFHLDEIRCDLRAIQSERIVYPNKLNVFIAHAINIAAANKAFHVDYCIDQYLAEYLNKDPQHYFFIWQQLAGLYDVNLTVHVNQNNNYFEIPEYIKQICNTSES